jgi:hypothetical protein
VEGPAVCLDGKTKPGDDSPTSHSLMPESGTADPSTALLGFPVGVSGVGEVHAPFLRSSGEPGPHVNVAGDHQEPTHSH